MKRISFFIMMILLSYGCTVNFKEKRVKDKEFPDFIMGDFKYVSFGDNGSKEWELRAKEAIMYNKKNKETIELYKLSIVFYKNGKISTFLTANKGMINKKTLLISAVGDVKIYSADQKVIVMTSKVFWDNDNEKFYTQPETVVKIKRGNSIITGTELIADVELKQLVLKNSRGNIKK